LHDRRLPAVREAFASSIEVFLKNIPLANANPSRDVIILIAPDCPADQKLYSEAPWRNYPAAPSITLRDTTTPRRNRAPKGHRNSPGRRRGISAHQNPRSRRDGKIAAETGNAPPSTTTVKDEAKSGFSGNLRASASRGVTDE
jgi:hypothetical protein